MTFTLDDSIKISSLTTASSGVVTMVMAYLNANAAGVGALCAIGSFIVLVITSAMKWRWYLGQIKTQGAVDD